MDHPSLTGRAYHRLRTDLLTCRIAPGERLNIVALSHQFGVSQSSVREALSRLTAEGLVSSEHNRGFQATPISPEDLGALTQARVELDGLCLRMAMRRADAEWEAELLAASHRALRRLQRAGDSEADADAFVAAHRTFLQVLIGGCGNPWLEKTVELLRTQTERYRSVCMPLRSHKSDFYAPQGEFLKAIMAGEEDRAAALLQRHYLDMTETIIAHMRSASRSLDTTAA